MEGEATISTERMEARLLRWGENNSSGQTVTFQINEDSHPFKGYASGEKNGQRFILVVAPINDSEEPVPPEAVKKRFHELSRAQQAGILCNDARFMDWFWNSAAANFAFSAEIPGETKAEIDAAAVRQFLGILSRSDLDKGQQAAVEWDALVDRYHEETRLPEQRG